jgi:hypothetical protein
MSRELRIPSASKINSTVRSVKRPATVHVCFEDPINNLLLESYVFEAASEAELLHAMEMHASYLANENNLSTVLATTDAGHSVSVHYNGLAVASA